MKGKKKEEVDLSTLPKANTVIASLMLDFKNPQSKFKVFETFYKNLQNDTVIHFITREHIIEYAKDAKIYVDPSEGKKSTAKDAAPIEKRDITSDELAKGCLGLINERSIAVRKEKKILLDKIDEAQKQKEEAEQYWASSSQNQTESDNKGENEVSKGTSAKKKQPTTSNVDKDAKAKKQGIIPPKPDEIEIPIYNDYDNEMLVVLYNYPMSEDEYEQLCQVTNETNDVVVVNMFSLLNDVDKYVEVKQEVVLDKKGKPVQPKQEKLPNDVVLMQKYFNSVLPLASVVNENTQGSQNNTGINNMKVSNVESQGKDEDNKLTDGNGDEQKVNTLPTTVSEVYDRLLELRNNSDKMSMMRHACFEKEDFSYENAGDDGVNAFYKQFIDKIVKMNVQYVYYKKWVESNKLIKLNGDEQQQQQEIKTFPFHECISINSNINYEKDTIGRNLFTFLSDFIRRNRLDTKNKLIYEINNFDDIFNDMIREYKYEYSTALNESNNNNNNNTSTNNNNNSNPPIQSSINKQLPQQQQPSTIKNSTTKNSVAKSKHSQQQQQPAGKGSIASKLTAKMSISEQNADDSINDNIEGEALSHIIVKHEKQHEIIDNEMSKCDINSTPFKLIINHNDNIYKLILEERINGKYICILEKNLNIFITNPHIEQCLQLYYNFNHISDYIHKQGINNEIYAYVLKRGISKAVYDKYYKLKKFEEMIMQKVPEQKLNFSNRKYEEVLSPDLFKQVLNDINMFDYETVACFDERTNKTLLAFYYRCPKGRVYRRKQEYRYLSKPDFEKWIKYFSPTFKQVPIDNSNKTGDDGDKKKEKNVNNSESTAIAFKYEVEQLNESVNNVNNVNNVDNSNPLYEADDINVGEVSERLKYMFPCDNGIIVKKNITTGIFTTTVSYIRKDDLIFGIKQTNDEQNEFWLNFSPELKMNVILKDEYDPYFKNHEEPTESNYGCIITFTLIDGTLVQILPNGEIVLKKHKNASTTQTPSSMQSSPNIGGIYSLISKEETYRIISSKASIIKHYPLETKILYSNGNACSIINNLATNINNKGHRVARSITEETDVSRREDIPVYKHHDPESNTNSIVREDNVIVISYPDNSRYVIHSDDTRIYTSPTVNEVTKYIVESDTLPSVEIIYDQVKKRTMTTIASGSTEALMGSEDLMVRSYDGRLSKVHLHDGTVIETYKEKKLTEEFETYAFNTVTVITRMDGTVVRVSQEGDIVIITSNERKKLNEKGMNLDFDSLKDTDYLFELNGKSDERKGGVYTCDMRKGKIWTKDDETNIFELHSNGDAKCKIQGTTIKEMNEKTIDEIIPDSPRYEGKDYIDPETRFSDPPSNFYPPRLFEVDNNDLSAVEYICDVQIEGYKRNMKKILKEGEYVVKKDDYENTITHLWIHKKVPYDDMLKQTHMIQHIVTLPQKYQKISQTNINPLYPEKDVYIVRKLKETNEVTNDVKQRIEQCEKELKEIKERMKIKKEKDVVDKGILRLNRDFQRRYLMEKELKRKKELNSS